MNDHAKHNPRLRQTVIVAVCVLAVLLFLYLLLRDRPGSASDYLDDSAPYTFDSSASRTFRTVDSRLAVVSSSGLQLLDDNGKTVLHEIFTLSQPGISVGGERVCAYDIGGTTLCVADFKGNKTDIEPPGEIISADLSDSGYLAVCSDAAGYKGAVTVYDTSGKAVYVWYSGTGYLVRAAVSPDGKYLAALCLQDSGSVVHTFALTSEDERGSAACADELFADLFWRGGKVCCVSQTRLAFFDDNAKLTAEYPFGDLYLYDYAAEGDGFVTLALSRYAPAAPSSSSRSMPPAANSVSARPPVPSRACRLTASRCSCSTATGSRSITSSSMRSSPSSRTCSASATRCCCAGARRCS